MSETLFKNVRLLDPENGVDQTGDLRAREGKIAEIGSKLDPGSAGEVIDGGSHVLVPGFVDLHSHLREPGFEHKETIETGTRAAAAGGFTTVCCMANTDPVNDRAAVTHYILEQSSQKASVRVWPIGAISVGLEGKRLAEMGELQASGCVAVSDDGMTVMDSRLMRIAMDYARGFNLLVITHSVDANLSAGGSMNEGETSCKMGVVGIPREAEDMIVARDIYLSRLTGCRLHVAHVSTAGSVELIRQAKAKGLPVTGEGAPHHFSLTDEACVNYDTNAKMCPPLRTEEDRQAVIEGLTDGTLEAIGTDHAPHSIVDKEVEFDQAAFGIIGFETALPLAYRLVEEGRLSLEQVILLLSAGPLKILGKPSPGIRKGAVADLALISLSDPWTYRVAESYSKSRNSPFDGWEFKAKVVGTWVGGKRVH